MAPLGNASALDCAIIRSLCFQIWQNGYASKSLHDGGFSNMSQEVMEMFE
jgi:hypothetical protein